MYATLHCVSRRQLCPCWLNVKGRIGCQCEVSINGSHVGDQACLRCRAFGRCHGKLQVVWKVKSSFAASNCAGHKEFLALSANNKIIVKLLCVFWCVYDTVSNLHATCNLILCCTAFDSAHFEQWRIWLQHLDTPCHLQSGTAILPVLVTASLLLQRRSTVKKARQMLSLLLLALSLFLR